MSRPRDTQALTEDEVSAVRALHRIATSRTMVELVDRIKADVQREVADHYAWLDIEAALRKWAPASDGLIRQVRTELLPATPTDPVQALPRSIGDS